MSNVRSQSAACDVTCECWDTYDHLRQRNWAEIEADSQDLPKH